MSEQSTRLSGVEVGQSCVIEAFTDDEMKLKLLEMGCLPGETVVIDRLAPMGDPMAIQVAGSIISIRMHEAFNVIVRPLS
ncbi:MAG TPA: FeoA family protein [Bacteroidia bacterium]|nr:FeoA family protein [Bacteroidia bacterium]